MHSLAARKYHTPRNGPLTLGQTETRRLAYTIKSTARASADFDTAAREMAALINGPCWLVPIPDSTGNTDANTRLPSMTARYVRNKPDACPVGWAQPYPTGARVVKAIVRTQPV